MKLLQKMLKSGPMNKMSKKRVIKGLPVYFFKSLLNLIYVLKFKRHFIGNML